MAGDRIPEHVTVDHDKQLIYVKPDQRTPRTMEILHEYNRVSGATVTLECFWFCSTKAHHEIHRDFA